MNNHAFNTPTHASAAAELTAAAVASAYRIARADLDSPRRGPARVARARQSAVYLAHVAFGLDFATLARTFGRDPSTVRHACRRIEDARDDERIDVGLTHLERAATELLRSLSEEPWPLVRHRPRAGG